MSNAINFLEVLGSNPALTRLSAAQYAATVALLDIDSAQRQALLNRDHAALNGLLGGRAKKMMLTVFPADDDKRDNEREHEAPIEETPPESE